MFGISKSCVAIATSNWSFRKLRWDES